MPKVPFTAPSGIGLFRNVSVIAAGLLVVLATTGAAAAPGTSRFELMMYAAGIVMGVRIVIVLFRMLIQAAFVLAIVGVVYYLAKVLVTAIFGG